MKILTTTIDGNLVYGVILIHDKTMCRVAITEPYSGLRVTAQILPRRVREKGSQHNTINPIVKPKELLARLYRVGKILNDCRDELIESYYDLELKTCHLFVEGLVPNRYFVALSEGNRSLLEQGELNEREYHEQMTDLRWKHSLYNERETVLYRDWIKEKFGAGIVGELQDQILSIIKQLREEKELKEGMESISRLMCN